MSRYLARYTPSRRFLSVTLFAFAGTLFSAWVGLSWWPSWIPAALFLLTTIGLAIITIRPVIEIHETHIAIGRRVISWNDVRAVDQTSWAMPLIMHLTLVDGQRVLVLYPGDHDGSKSLCRHIQRLSRRAFIQGVPYRQFWGESAASLEREAREREAKELEAKRQQKMQEPAPTRYPVLRSEDEDEVERMFQRLKATGKVDARSSEEK
ncbi:MAG: hypothetical protein ABL967_02160 [Bryobacteraceae bacterium]